MLVLDSRDLKKRCSLWSERERERERESGRGWGDVIVIKRWKGGRWNGKGERQQLDNNPKTIRSPPSLC
jgi:hypothetical protein